MDRVGLLGNLENPPISFVSISLTSGNSAVSSQEQQIPNPNPAWRLQGVWKRSLPLGCMAKNLEKIFQSNSTAFGKAPRREADSQPISQSVSQSGKQAGRQAGRSTQFGFFFSSVDYVYKQWGTPDAPDLSVIEWQTASLQSRPAIAGAGQLIDHSFI